MDVPPALRENCARNPAASAWLEGLPRTVAECARAWSLRLGSPFAAAQAWVAPAELADGTPVVLKLGLPHFEAEQESEGLRVWTFARAALMSGTDPARHWATEVARRLE